MKRRILAAAAALTAAAGLAIGLSSAAGASSTPVVYHGCESTSTGRIPFNVFTVKTPVCPSNAWHVSWNQQGQPGVPGPQGPSGVVATKTTDFGGVASVPTGGRFFDNKTLVGTVTLDAGTYLINVNVKATPPAGGTGTVDVFPQFFVYNGAALADFSNDLFNLGSGALESGSFATINSYYSGSGEIVVPAGGETLDVYAFGYDSDTSAGSYVLNDLSVTTTSLNPAS